MRYFIAINGVEKAVELSRDTSATTVAKSMTDQRFCPVSTTSASDSPAQRTGKQLYECRC